MKVAFEEIGHLSATFETDTAKPGDLCKMAGNGKVAVCRDGDQICGKTEMVRCGFAGVQIHGFIQVSYTGTEPALGYAILVADGKGGVKTNSTGKAYLVVSVDTAAKTMIMEL